MPDARAVLFTVGYENATVDSFLGSLTRAGVRRVADVRAVAGSRRPGFAKTRLTENLAAEGIGYLHLRGLGTPAEGRAAARAGRTEEMQRIYLQHLETATAQTDLQTLVDLVPVEPICILCLEDEPSRCHRSLVAAAVAERLPIDIVHLLPAATDA